LSEAPFLLILAGPNGSGKSTLTNYLIEAGIDFGEYINPDEIALTLNEPEPQRSKRAQEIADFDRDCCLSARLNFSFETVMSHQSKIDLLVRAGASGYDVTLYFICTSDPEINIRRVQNRVSLGGHDVPRDRIVARYWRSLNLLCNAALVARRVVLFDNSAEVGYRVNSLLPNPQNGLRPVCQVVRNGKDYTITLGSDTPAWVAQYLVNPMDALARSAGTEITLAIDQRTEPLG
jgi:predicted ABC-type ATPase